MDLYYLIGSSPCRAVLMTAKALGIELNKKVCNIQNGETMTPEFLKLNPQHTIPTLVDNDIVLWESRAIMIYLVEKYGEYDCTLYPKCPKNRAVINQRLYFDMGTLYGSLGDYYYSQFFYKKPADPEKFKKVENALELLDTFLQGETYVAGDTLTIADITTLATISTFSVAGLNLDKYPNVMRWYETAKKETPGWDENWEGCLVLKQYFNL